MPKFFIKTYGCQMNERDSEQVAHSLITRGYERVGHESEADVVLLNTCSVRDTADQKALGKMGMLGRLAKERPHVVFGFLGCMAQARGGELLKGLPHVDLVVGTQKFHRVADYVDELVARENGALGRIADPDSTAAWTICGLRSSTSLKKPVRNRRSGNRNSPQGRRPCSSLSCRGATCTAHSASCRRRVARSAAAPSTKL